MITTSILTAGTNSHPTTAEEANRFLTNFVTPGVVGTFTNTAGLAPMTGSFGTNPNTGTDKNIVIAVGDAVATATPTGQASQNLQLRNTSTITKLLSDNISGSTQYDWVYLAVDATKANNPALDSSDVTAITVVRGTSATVPPAGAPTFANLLAVITLLTGYTAVTNGMIADKRVIAGAALPDGSVTNVKISSVSAIKITNPYKFRVYLTAATSTINGDKLVPFETVSYDTSSNVNITSNKGRFVAPIAGFYHFDAQVNLAGGGYCYTQLWKNGAVASRGNYFAASGISLASTVADTIQLAANDYIEVYINSNGVNSLITGSFYTTYFSGFLVSTT